MHTFLFTPHRYIFNSLHHVVYDIIIDLFALQVLTFLVLHPFSPPFLLKCSGDHVPVYFFKFNLSNKEFHPDVHGHVPGG